MECSWLRLVALCFCICASPLPRAYPSHDFDIYVFPVGWKGREDFLSTVDESIRGSNCSDAAHLSRLAVRVSEMHGSHFHIISRRISYVETATECRHDHSAARGHDWDLYARWSVELEGRPYAHLYTEALVRALKAEGRSAEALQLLDKARHGDGDRFPSQLARFLEVAGSLLMGAGEDRQAVTDLFECVEADPAGEWANNCMFHLFYAVQRIAWDYSTSEVIPVVLPTEYSSADLKPKPSQLPVGALVERATHTWLGSRWKMEHSIVDMAKLLSVWSTPVFTSQSRVSGDRSLTTLRRKLDDMMEYIDRAQRHAYNDEPPFMTIGYAASKGTSFGPFELLLDNKCDFARSLQSSNTEATTATYRPFTLLVEPGTVATVETTLRDRQGQVWIVKSCDGADGDGIFLRSSEQLALELPSLLQMGTFVVEVYMARPLLLNGKKFDIKIQFALVGNANVDCFGLLALKDGKVRSSNTPYRLGDYDDLTIHLTNTAVRMTSDQWSAEPPVITIRDLSQLVGGWDDMWSRLKTSLGRTLSAVRGSEDWKKVSDTLERLEWPMVSVAMYTADIIVSQEGFVWVLEVNATPGQQQPWKKWVDLERSRAQSYLSLAKRTTELTAVALDIVTQDLESLGQDYNSAEHQPRVCEYVVEQLCNEAPAWGFEHVPL